MAKRGLLLVGIAAAVVVAWFVPAASAKSSPRVRLPLIPLPKAALGLAAHSLALAHDSGVISNTAAANRSFSSPPPARFKQMGRIIGYGLAYGDEATGSVGDDSVWTSVDEYKNARTRTVASRSGTRTTRWSPS